MEIGPYYQRQKDTRLCRFGSNWLSVMPVKRANCLLNDAAIHSIVTNVLDEFTFPGRHVQQHFTCLSHVCFLCFHMPQIVIERIKANTRPVTSGRGRKSAEQTSQRFLQRDAYARCLSVCLSVTRRHSVETAKHIIKVFSPSPDHSSVSIPNGMAVLWRGPPPP